jgi:DNA-binding CsgD family transcriptional regulator
MVVAGGRQVIGFNDVARSVIRAGVSFAIVNGRLYGRTRAAQRSLEKLFCATSTPSPTVSIKGMQLQAIPLPRDPDDVLGHNDGWVVVRLSGPAVDSITRQAFLRARYGVTESEARVADLLAAGHRVGEIATRLHRSRETIRTHLKRLFTKTGSSTQRALIELFSLGRPTGDPLAPLLRERRELASRLDSRSTASSASHRE